MAIWWLYTPEPQAASANDYIGCWWKSDLPSSPIFLINLRFLSVAKHEIADVRGLLIVRPNGRSKNIIFHEEADIPVSSFTVLWKGPLFTPKVFTVYYLRCWFKWRNANVHETKEKAKANKRSAFSNDEYLISVRKYLIWLWKLKLIKSQIKCLADRKVR